MRGVRISNKIYETPKYNYVYYGTGKSYKSYYDDKVKKWVMKLYW